MSDKPVPKGATPAAEAPPDQEKLGEDWQRGTRIRRAVLGDAHVDRSEREASAFDADFQAYITRTAWGAVWARPGLPLGTRQLLTIAMLAALGRQHELELHLKATRNTGVTPAEVKEVLLQVAVYAGVPAANAAFALAKRVLFAAEGTPEPSKE